MKLEFHEPICIDRVLVTMIEKKDVQEEVDYWKNDVVRYVVGYLPRMKDIQAFVNGMWNLLPNHKPICINV